MQTKDYDLIVLGGGNAITVAIDAGKAGLRVALIEKGPLGGTCPNRGCIPSKLLIAYADVSRMIRQSDRFHIDASIHSIDGDTIVQETFAATSQTDKKLEGVLPDSVDLYRGEGSFVNNTTVAVGDATLTGQKILLATGSRPTHPDLPGLDGVPYWTSDDVFSLSKLPESISIIGGGYIACELAHFFHGVGVETTLIYRGSKLLKAEDTEIQSVFQEGFCSEVTVKFETSISSMTHDSSGFHLDLINAGSIQKHTSEAVLFAIGRTPNTDTIGLENTNISFHGNGFVAVDMNQKTSAANVYALGDVTGRYMFTHAASFEAAYLSKVFIDNHTASIDYGPMPHAVFSVPEVAGVGATEQELMKSQTVFLKASVPYSSAAKGRAIKEMHGLCKFLLKENGEILGCHIVGHESAALLHEVIPVMKWRNHISSLTEIIHIHPSLSEIVRNAARQAESLVK